MILKFFAFILQAKDLSAVKLKNKSLKTNGISPMLQLDLMFKGECGQYKSNLLKNSEVTQAKHKITFEYLKNRGDLVNRILSMAQKFN